MTYTIDHDYHIHSRLSMCSNDPERTFSRISEEEMYRLLKQAAAAGLGIEINAGDMRYSEQEADIVLRPFRIAKECGCQFYLGSDAHHPNELDGAIPLFQKGIDALGLQESDKYHIPA